MYGRSRTTPARWASDEPDGKDFAVDAAGRIRRNAYVRGVHAFASPRCVKSTRMMRSHRERERETEIDRVREKERERKGRA